MPGAVNVPAEQMVANDGTRLTDAATIDRVLAKASAKTKGRQISFSNNGRLASGAWFVLHEVKGNKWAALYVGSMSEWTSDIQLLAENDPHS